MSTTEENNQPKKFVIIKKEDQPIREPILDYQIDWDWLYAVENKGDYLRWLTAHAIPEGGDKYHIGDATIKIPVYGSGYWLFTDQNRMFHNFPKDELFDFLSIRDPRKIPKIIANTETQFFNYCKKYSSIYKSFYEIDSKFAHYKNQHFADLKFSFYKYHIVNLQRNIDIYVCYTYDYDEYYILSVNGQDTKFSQDDLGKMIDFANTYIST
jgi:hypothetical protein